MKKIILSLVSLFLMLSLVSVVSATDRYVATSCTGEPTPCYTTIQAAINDAATSGDTINVAAGTYAEAVTIDKSITLLGAKANVDPRGGAWTGDISIINPGTGNWGVDIQASDVIFNGFEVTGGVYGIYIGSTDASNIEIMYNDLHDNSKYGCQPIGIGVTVSDITISKNYFHHNSRNGLKMVDVTDCVVDSNEFAHNGFGTTATKPEYKYGIFLEDQRYNNPIYSPAIRNTFTNNIFHDNNLGAINMEVMGNAVGSYWTSTEFLEDTVVHNNNFYGDSSVWGINVDNDYNDDGTQDGFGPISTVDAENNYWGDVTGPYHATTNPSGQGNKVSDNVDYDPFLKCIVGAADDGILNVPSECSTIQAAIDAANPGNTINVAAGTYTEGLSISKSIHLIGENKDTVIIDATSKAYGIGITGDNVEIEGLTVKYATNYNIHSSHNTGFNIHNVHVIGQGQFTGNSGGIDLNNAPNSIVDNVISEQNSKNGISILASNNVQLSNFVVDYNGQSQGWAGVAVYTYNINAPGSSGDSSVLISGTNTISNNPMGIYLEDYPTYTITPTVTGTTTFDSNQVSLLSLGYGTVTNLDQFAKDLGLWARITGSEPTLPNVKAYFKTKEDACTAALGSSSPDTSVIFDLSENNYFVCNGLKIQPAIDDATAGDTINVAAGTYTENVVIDKSLILQGAGSGVTTIDGGSAGNGITITTGGISAIQRLEIKDLRITNAAYGIRTAGTGLFKYFTFENLVIDLNTDRGIELHNNFNIEDIKIISCQITNNGGQGIRTASNVILNGMTITDSNLDQNTYGIYLQGTISDVTILGSTFNDQINYGAYMTETGPLNGLTIEDSEFNNNVVGLMVWNVQDNADITITNTQFNNNDKWGVLIWGDSLTNVLITGSEVLNNDQLNLGYAGLDFYTYAETAASMDVVVRYTNIDGQVAGIGLKNRAPAGTGVVDARYNWWGDVSGPYHPESWTYNGDTITNPLGLGDKVTNYVLYDPWIGQGGMVTGGGWIMSPAGAYTADPELSGKATFGFVSMYKKGAAVPTGKTQFNFQVADLNFHSDSYDWLVIAGAKAMYKGTGTINDAGNYGFMLSAIDNDIDMFRIKIFDKATDTVIYDNKVDGEDGTVVAGGRIVIHKKK